MHKMQVIDVAMAELHYRMDGNLYAPRGCLNIFQSEITGVCNNSF